MFDATRCSRGVAIWSWAAQRAAVGALGVWGDGVVVVWCGQAVPAGERRGRRASHVAGEIPQRGRVGGGRRVARGGARSVAMDETTAGRSVVLAHRRYQDRQTREEDGSAHQDLGPRPAALRSRSHSGACGDRVSRSDLALVVRDVVAGEVLSRPEAGVSQIDAHRRRDDPRV
jgi:hypothetical protein